MWGDAMARLVEDAWTGDAARHRLTVAALRPLAAVYGGVVRARNLAYDRGWSRVERVPATVLGVGSLTVGGSGKTPVAIWLAETLLQRGRRVAIVGRGYGKRQSGVVVVGANGRVLVEPAIGGDEAVLAASRVAVPVVTAERRVLAAREVCMRFGCDTIVLDDGFQHRGLARDADLVLVPADGLPQRLLPAGPLREDRGALRRARAVLALGDETRVPSRPEVPPGVAAFVGRIIPTAAVTAEGDRLLTHDLAGIPRRGAVAVAGVARPERFWSMLERLGIMTLEQMRFPDHHVYDAADVARLRTIGAAIVTTEKDLVKLARLPGAEALDLWAVRVEVVVEEGGRLVDRLLEPAEVALRRD